MGFRAFDHCVSVIAYQKDGRKYGMTCAWAMQVDYDKLVCLIGSQSDTGRQIKEGQEIGVSVLAKHQKAIAEHFGEEHSSSFDKFEGVTYTEKESALLIPNSARAMVCQVIEVLHLKGIEEDQLVYTALYNLKQAFILARRSKEKTVCLIVGYGSTGGTHKIKTAVLLELERLANHKQIKGYILGSELDIFNPKYQTLSGREWIDEACFKRKNPGEVIVIL